MRFETKNNNVQLFNKSEQLEYMDKDDNIDPMSLYNNKEGIHEIKAKHIIFNNNGDPILTDSRFKDKIYMIIFYAPWCGHCKNMVNDITELGKQLGDEGFLIGAVNCDNMDNKQNKCVQSINGYPTIYFVKNNKSDKYGGGRDIESLLNHLCNNLQKCKK
jgi:protein disulfide-isomerase